MKSLNIDRIIEVDTIEQLFINLFAFCSMPENSPLIFKHLRQMPPEEMERNRQVWREYFASEGDALWRNINTEKLILKIKQVCNGRNRTDVVLFWALLEVLDEMTSSAQAGISISQRFKSYNGERYIIALRLRSPFRSEYERRNAAGYGFRSAIKFRSELSDQLQHIIVTQAPAGYHIRFLSVERNLERRLRGLESELTVGVFSLGRDIEYDFKGQSVSESKTNYRFDTIINPDEVNEQLKKILQFATSERVHIVVLPELTVDQSGRETIKEFLKSQSHNPAIISEPRRIIHCNGSVKFFPMVQLKVTR